jgi:hypothetical protein
MAEAPERSTEIGCNNQYQNETENKLKTLKEENIDMEQSSNPQTLMPFS